MYLIRLDDASEHMDLGRWEKVEEILDTYNVRPIFGIIPDNKDPKLLKYNENSNFWELMHSWIDKGWTPAMHGYQHLYSTTEGGINPVNKKSEFAGLPLEQQKLMIEKGYNILIKNNILPDIFFAPSHTFDDNTLKAIKDKTSIKVISDTIAVHTYYQDGFYFIPQQSGKCRRLPLKTVTICLHPNTMEEEDFQELRGFLIENQKSIASYSSDMLVNHKIRIVDKILRWLYFARKR